MGPHPGTAGQSPGKTVATPTPVTGDPAVSPACPSLRLDRRDRGSTEKRMASIRRPRSKNPPKRDETAPSERTSLLSEKFVENGLEETGRNASEEETRHGLDTVNVPDPLDPIFLKAQRYVHRYFEEREERPQKGLIRISGERYLLIRAASMSKEFFELVLSLYRDRSEGEARRVASGFLYDMAHSIGKADARSFHSRMGVTEPIEKFTAGPIHFAYTGWAIVTVLPESNPTPDEHFFLIYDHPFSFEANTWLQRGETTDFPVCIMNAGYSSGWCEESFGIPLVSVEIECQARGDEHCRFIMAPPAKIEEYISKYSTRAQPASDSSKGIAVPEFFQRKRLEDELRRHRDHLQKLVEERTERLTRINEQLQNEITERLQVERALQESETLLRAIFDQTFQFVAILKLDGTAIKINKTALNFVKAGEKDITGIHFWETPFWRDSPEGQYRLRQAVDMAAKGRLVRFETTHTAPDGRVMNVDFSLKPVRDASGKIVLLIAEGRDITDIRLAMEDLRRREAELKIQSRHLEEANVALKVLLKQMEEKKREDQENILANVNQLVLPYIQRLKGTLLNKDQSLLLQMLETNLAHITSPLVSRLSSSFLNLTPMEIRIAHLIKEGLMNKEIADLLGSSLNTISSHRYKIRTKLGLKKKGINLRSYLLSLEE